MTACHYTTRDCALAILQSGFILAATAYVPENETPVVWFSRARTWEPTATKHLVSSRGGRGATFREMTRIGIARFADDADRLLAWPALCEAANIAPATAVALACAGRKQGANPGDWCGSLDPVPMADVLRIETFDAERNTWRDFTLAELAGAAA
jgi:hypothetical protein